jgi:integrase
MKELLNRNNWTDIQEFLAYKEKVDQNSIITIERLWCLMRHLIEWAGIKPLTKAHQILPSFPVYLLTARNDTINKPLSPASLMKICNYTKMYFRFMKEKHPDRYRSIQPDWIRTLKPSKSHGMESVLPDHSYYSLENVLKIASTPVNSLTQERDRAAVCFLFLSGMRIDAFVSLPINCIDLEKRKIQQIPSKGVRTKNHKAANTTLLRIPELMKIVLEWDKKVRGYYPDNSPWYPRIKNFNDGLDHSLVISKDRKNIFAKGLRELCELAGIPYLSTHKLRHGHVVYALKRVKDMAGLKAVSKNVMHSNVGITDSVYGGFLQDDVFDTISALEVDAPEEKPASNQSNPIIDALLKKLTDNPELLLKLMA